MDLNQLLHRQQVSLMRADRSAGEEERRAHSQFARDYSVQIKMVRDRLGAAEAVCGFPT